MSHHVGHDEVHEDGVEWGALEHGLLVHANGLQPILRLDHDVTALREESIEHLAIRCDIIHNLKGKKFKLKKYMIKN